MVPFEIDSTKEIDFPAWIQAGSAVFTSLGLIITLFFQARATKLQARATEAQVKATNAQIDSNKLQIQINNRDYDRYIQSIAPITDFTLRCNEDNLSGTFTIKIKNNHAYDFLVEYAGKNYVDIIGLTKEPFHLSQDTILTSAFEVNLDKALQTFSKKEDIIVFLRASYKDHLGNKYSQSINGILNIGKFHHEIPIMESNSK